MKTTSFLSNAIEGYVKYRKASGRDSHSYIKNVMLFDHFCAREYPGQIELSQEIVDRWCRQRPSECTNSCVSRVYPILDFIKYMNKRGMTKKQKLKIELADYIYNKLRKIDEIDRGSKAFNWFESTGLNANTENRFHHKMRIWKFIPNSYRKNKGWENDNLTKEGYFVKDIFETEVLQGNEEG